MLHPLFALVVLAAPAPDPVVPAGPPPQLAVVHLTRDGDLVQRAVVAVAVPVLREKTIIVKGKEVKVTEAATMVEYRTEERTTKVRGLEAYDTAGKLIPAERLPELLARDTLVLISADGKKLDPACLRVIKEGTLILVLPPPMVNPR
jgi:hypothetical protein